MTVLTLDYGPSRITNPGFLRRASGQVSGTRAIIYRKLIMRLDHYIYGSVSV